MKSPSKERGCDGKKDLGDMPEAGRKADILAGVYGKSYGLYRCPHCGGTHLTTKLENKGNYPPLLHETSQKT